MKTSALAQTKVGRRLIGGVFIRVMPSEVSSPNWYPAKVVGVDDHGRVLAFRDEPDTEGFTEHVSFIEEIVEA